MIDFKKIIEDIISNNLTVLEASQKYNCSESSIRKYIRKLKESNELSDINLYNRYLDVARNSQKNGRKKGGTNSKRTTTLSKEEINNLYELIVNEDRTLREVEEKTRIPSSTIYDNLMANLSENQKKQIQEVFDKHRRNAANDYQNDTENSIEFHRVGTEISKPGTRKKI